MRFANKMWWLCLAVAAAAACGSESKENAAPGPEALGTSEQAVSLGVPYISQYQGLSSSNCDCGPADVAMIVRYFGLSSLGDQALVSQVRARTGTSGCVYTSFGHLQTALTSYGLTYQQISQYSSPAPGAQMTAMANATAQNKPVIALVHGADFGRGEAYGDHWVVVRGFSADMQWVYLNDPDNQGAAGRPGWIVGGQITLSSSTFSTAALHASQRQGAPYGIIVTGPSSGGGGSPWCSASCGGGGWWCAGDGACIQNGVAGHNYHCPGNNMAPDRDQGCSRGCHIAAAGYPDYCNYGAYCGGGSWCGNDCVGGDPTTLYNFSGGALSSVTQCSVGYANRSCAIAAAGYSDYCF